MSRWRIDKGGSERVWSRAHRAGFAARRAVSPALAVVRRGLDVVPLTPLGLGVGAGSALALDKLAYAQLDLVWLMVGYAGVGLVVGAALLVSLGALLLKLGVRRASSGRALRERRWRTETQRSLPTGFSAGALRFMPLLQVSWSWQSPPGVTARLLPHRFFRLREEVAFDRRGRFDRVVRRFVVRDVFGLSSLAFRHPEAMELSVLPHVGKLNQLPLLVSMTGGDERPHPMGVEHGDRVELRRYAPGDPARFIHWKVFSRTRKLVVRVPERALSPAHRTVAYLVAGGEDEASAAAARVAVESGALGGEWVFGADGSEGETSSVEEALEMIVRSASAASDGAAGLAAFLDRVERRGPASAVVFVPPTPGGWLDRVGAALARRALRSRVVVATDGVSTAARAPWWRTLLLDAPAEAGTSSRSLSAVLRRLHALRCEVIHVDRVSGRRLSAGHRRSMEALEAEAVPV